MLRDWDYHVIHFLYFPFNYPYVWLPVAFWLGAMLGSFLNVCVGRLPRGRSVLWPRSHCLQCYQPVRGWDNIPIFSFCWLGGRCRSCGARFSAAYLGVELLLAALFAGLWLTEVAWNVRHVGHAGRGYLARAGGSDLALVWLNYATFLFFALGIALMARLGSSVPTSFVMPGFLLGFFFAGLGPWPWPASWTPQALAQTPGHFAIAPQGMQLAPLWNPPPAWLIPDQPCFGLATAATGALMIGLGMMMADLVSRALRRRRAFHPQDILVGTLVGAYLGWQAGLVASLMAVFFWGVIRLMGRLDQPFLFWLASCSIGVLLLWSFVLVLGQQLGQ